MSLFNLNKKTINLSEKLKEIINNSFGDQLKNDGWIDIPYKIRPPFSSVELRKIINNDFIVGIDAQRDKYWEKSKGKFTFNLNIFFIPFEKFYGRSGIDCSIDSEIRWTLSERIGVLKTGKDEWYEISQKTNFLKIENQITQDFKEICFPWFNKISDRTNILNLLAVQQKATAVAMLVYYEKIVEAKKMFFDFLKIRPNFQVLIIKKMAEWNLIESHDFEKIKNALIQSNDNMNKILNELSMKYCNK